MMAGGSNDEDYDNDKDEGMKNIERKRKKKQAKTLCTYYIDIRGKNEIKM